MKNLEGLSNLDKNLLNDLLQVPLASQDKIWLETNEERLKRLEQEGYVKKDGNIWSLTEFGRMCAVAAEGEFRKAHESAR